MAEPSVLIIDDDESQLSYLSSILELVEKPALRIFTAASAEEGFRIIENNFISLVITDYMMPGMGGDMVLKTIKERNPSIDVALLTSLDDIGKALEVMRQGAY
jgi:DNA-binding NtrC family response regulator